MPGGLEELPVARIRGLCCQVLDLPIQGWNKNLHIVEDCSDISFVFS